MRIKLYNDFGSVTFGGKYSEGTSFFIKAAEGFGLAEKTFSTASYSGYPGTSTTGISIDARTITISADMKVDAGFQKRYSRLLAILNKGGYLEIYEKSVRRKIQWMCASFVPGEKNKVCFGFTIQLICDYPYFSDINDTEIYVFKRTSMIDSVFKLPGVFTERISRSNVVYAGSTETEPIFIIDILSDADGEAAGGITLTNHTYGETIKFDYNASSGERITIDVGKPSVYSSTGENLINYISDDTYLDSFHLYPGINDIEVLNLNDNTAINVKCIYSCKYIEAVV